MNKENNERIEKIKDFIRDKGVYLVLMLCMAVIGIAAAAAYLPPKGELQPSPLPEQAQLAEQVSYSEDESLSALLSPSPTPEATPAPVPDVTPDPSAPPAASPLLSGKRPSPLWRASCSGASRWMSSYTPAPWISG